VGALSLDPAEAFTRIKMDFEVTYLVTSQFSKKLGQSIETSSGGPTTSSFTADEPANLSLGEISGFGTADFGSLSASFQMSGSAADLARVTATSHDVITVAPPTGPRNCTAGRPLEPATAVPKFP